MIDGGKTVISNNFYEHHHSLNATEEGVYMCTVSNDTPDSVNATLNATSKFLRHIETFGRVCTPPWRA